MALKVDQVASAACNAKGRVEQRREVHGSLIFYKTVGQGYIYLTLFTRRILSLEPREPACNPGLER
jgi:hypothetical protein